MFNTNPPAYEPGDTIEYQPERDVLRHVLVQYRDENIKNDRPGFDGLAVDGGADEGMSVWGYDYQITRVVREVAR